MRNIKLYFVILVLCTINGISAQVGIGTTMPNASSLLDLTSANSGLLIPRISLLSNTDVVTIPTPLTSLLVYNTGFAPNGYYYWNGSLWAQLSTGTNSDWSLTGNAGTVAGTNFLGTTNAVDLRIKTQGFDRWNISNANNGQLQSYSLGTALLPAYSFNADTNTGIFSTSSDILGFSTNGTEKFRIPNADQVHAMSLGTTALPFYSFSADPDTGIYSSGANILGFSTNGTERLRIPNANQVHAMSFGTAALPFYSFDTNTATGIYNPGANTIGFSTNGNERLRIPNANQVHAMSLGTVGLPFYSFSTDTDSGIYSPGANILGFSTNGTEKLRIEADGDVGIGATPNISAKLEINATDRGLLIPNVALTAKNTVGPITSPANSLLVYNTATAGAAPNNVFPGYYYYNLGTTSWIALSGSGSNNWSILGNSGTTAANYIGTTDAVALKVNTAATERMRVLANGQIVVNNTAAPFATDRFSVYNTTTSDFAINGYSTLTGVGVYGENTGTGRGVQGSNSGTGRGVIGFSASTGVGVQGQNSGTGIGVSGFGVTTGYGVYGQNSGTGNAIRGNNTGTGIGVIGFSLATSVGVQGQNAGTGVGVAGFGVSTGIGVYGQNTANGPGIQAVNTNNGDGLQIFQTGIGDGIYNQVAGGNGIYNVVQSTNFGVYTDLTTAGGTAYYADLFNRDGSGFVFDNVGASSNADGFGFDGTVNTATASGAFVNGAVLAGVQSGLGHGMLLIHSGTQGRNAEIDITNTNNNDPAIFAITQGGGSAVLAQNQDNTITGVVAVGAFSYTGTDSDDHIGVRGSSSPAAGKGIGVDGTGGLYGVHGTGGTYGVFSTGDFGGTGAKYFVIDHPLDPENKYLRHANIESNEILNFYRGTAIFDETGKATITLPNYYEAINKNASYQLTPVGAAMPNLFVEKEIKDGKFIIAGGVSGKKVSWNVTAERNDPYLQQNPDRRNVEVDKGSRRGEYLTPELYGQPKEKGISYKEEIVQNVSKIAPRKEISKKNNQAVRKIKEIKAENASIGSDKEIIEEVKKEIKN